MGFFQKIAQGIKKTKDSIAKKLFYAFSAKELDDEFYESLEEALLAGDVGVTAAESVVEELKDRVFREKIKAPEDAKGVLKEILVDNIDYDTEEYSYPLVILLSGVNGVGKTTAIGKLAHMFREQGRSVVIAAAASARASRLVSVRRSGITVRSAVPNPLSSEAMPSDSEDFNARKRIGTRRSRTERKGWSVSIFGPIGQPRMRSVSQTWRMSFANVGIKRNITAAGRNMAKGRRRRSSVESRSSTRVVIASTMTTFIMEAPRRNGMPSAFTESPLNPGMNCSRRSAQPSAMSIMTPMSAYRSARSAGRFKRSA